MKKYFVSENGQAMVVAALSMIVIMGFAAFGIDTGRLLIQESNMQNIADAAALAAAQDLPTPSASIATALNYANQNGMKSTQSGIAFEGDTVTVVAPFAGDTKKVEVICSRKVDFIFARVLGYTDKTVTAKAVAEVTTAAGAIFNYAVFAGEGQASFGGSDHNFGGSVYGRDGVSLGNKANVTGNVVSTSSGTINSGSGSVITGSVIGNSAAIQMPDFSEQIKAQAIVVNSQAEFNNVVNGKKVSGPIYVNGNVTINGRINGTGVIYASGTIAFANDTILQTSSDHILFYAAKGDLKFNGGNGVNVGILYVPNGKITVNGAPNSTTYGRLIAKSIEFNGSKASVYPQAGDLNSLGTLTSTKLVL
jgi:Flp pilus assembly protein TadG